MAKANVQFNHAFSPQEGLTAAVEQPWRQEICLNGKWEFQPVALPRGYDIKNGAPQLTDPDPESWSATPIRIPSAWNVNGYSRGPHNRIFPSYPAEWDRAHMGWLRRLFKVPSGWTGKRLVLHFEAVSGYAQVIVNGQLIAEHFENSLPFEVDVTDFVKPDADNKLWVGIREAGLFNVPGKYGKLVYPAGPPWLVRTTGIWQDVFLRALPPLRVEETIVRPWVDQGVLELIVTVRNTTAHTQTFRLGGQILPWKSLAGKDVISAPEPKWTLGSPALDIAAIEGTVGPKRTTTLTFRQPIHGELALWTPETPNLYGLVLDLHQDGKTEDRSYQRFGWRQWGIHGRDVTLNGKQYQLRGDTTYVEGVSYLSRRYVWAKYHTMKLANVNAVRLHVVLRPRFYLDLADEMGLAILDESEVWASAMDYNYDSPDTWLRFGAHLDGMVKRDRNHACVFGWSVFNEILSALWYKGVPRELWPPVIDKAVEMADRVRALDPTRQWVSSDGDGDFQGRLPVYSYHYGDPRDWVRNAPKDRPFAVGEGGSMLWGSPVVFSAYNGERSYESDEGMSEGAAIECYHYLVEQRKLAAFCSIFTLESAGLKALPLGMADRNAAPTADDGIVFGPFVEGQPGMQPERLPPYSTPYNPGYDPNLPLFETTPVFDAVKAAYEPSGPAPCAWDHKAESKPLPAPPKAHIDAVAFVGDPSGPLWRALRRSGVPVVSGNSKLLVIDGAKLPESDSAAVSKQAQAVLKNHGTVFIWASSQSVDAVNRLLPAPLSFMDRISTALLADRSAPETASIPLASLYFADQSDKIVARSALSGPLVEGSKILMESSAFRRRLGPKSSSGAPVLISYERDGGRLLVTSLLPDTRSERRVQLLRSLFANLGVVLGTPDKSLDTGIDGAGYVKEALMLGSFQGDLYPHILDHDYLGGETAANPKVGDKAGDRVWQHKATLGDGIFDFFRMELPGTEGSRARSLSNFLKPESLDANGYLVESERLFDKVPGIHSVAYLSFWVYAPESVPAGSISLLVTSDDGTKVWLNKTQIHEDRLICGPGFTNYHKLPLDLKTGWNHLLFKVGQFDGPWSFSARFDGVSLWLIEQLRVSANPPESLQGHGDR